MHRSEQKGLIQLFFTLKMLTVVVNAVANNDNVVIC